MKRVSVFILLYLIGLSLVLFVLHYQLTLSFHQNSQQQAQVEVESLSQYINSRLARFQNIPGLLASNYMIRQGVGGNADQEGLNHLLLEIGQSAGADDVYLMDPEGTVLAASNYQQPQSFIGSNFAFRPYFQQAVQGRENAYYALGQRSQERGFFFSAPVVLDGQIQGVITVKVAVSLFEQDTELLSGSQGESFILYGLDRVIFMSNKASWRLKQWRESERYSWQQIAQSQRYLDLEQDILVNQRFQAPWYDSEIWQLPLPQNIRQNYFYAQANIPLMDLTLVLLLPDKPGLYYPVSYLILAALAYSVLLALVIHLYRHQAGYNQLLYTRNSLEKEVSIRSKELAKAQDALIRAAKLATIGQLSASINHEINQPLSAMSTYLVSSRRMIDKGMYDQAKENLYTLESLVHRVHKIVAQLKQFSRLEQQEQSLKPVPLQQCIDNALVIVGPEIKKRHVELQMDLVDTEVRVEALKFEQVLVNLLSNAIDAMETVEHKRLTLVAQISDQDVVVTISDTGPGLDLLQIDTIFEPFFTTKSEHGLGLGLSIARNIMLSFDGELSAANQDTGGAIFTVRLKRDQN